MSSAFDTIDRSKLIDIVSLFLDHDEVQLIQVLLADTSLILKYNDEETKFDTIIGTPQGDSLSPVLFIIYLEAALREVRPLITTPTITPSEMVYADDVDFIFDNEESAKQALPIIVSTLQKWNLIVNESKTEFTEVDKSKNEWKTTKKLGSCLGDEEDIGRRKTLATIALKNMSKSYLRNSNISEDKRIRLYNALVLPILTYNSSVWALTKTMANSIDAFHRRQLRSILGVKYPEIISNSNLYSRCKAQPLSSIIAAQRWSMLGHSLRLHEETPAQKAMTYYFKDGPKFRGKTKTTLPVTIDNDLKTLSDILPQNALHDHTYSSTTPTSCITLKSEQDLNGLRNLAHDKPRWKTLRDELQKRRASEVR